jgi:protein arginine kinase activator
MLCDVCKEAEATVHLTQVINGKVQKVDLCETCAKEKGVSDPAGFSLADLLLGLGAGENIQPEPGMVRCSVCGLTQADFKKTGRLGCSHCYDTFNEGLSALLKGMHRGTQHVGKVPPSAARRMEREKQLRDLRQDLDKAIDSENYELAASLRDKIRSLEKATT